MLIIKKKERKAIGIIKILKLKKKFKDKKVFKFNKEI